jgi:hypothetical protein
MIARSISAEHMTQFYIVLDSPKSNNAMSSMTLLIVYLEAVFSNTLDGVQDTLFIV